MKSFSGQFHLYRWLRIIFLVASGTVILVNPEKSFDTILYLISGYLIGSALIAISDGIILRKHHSDNGGPFASAIIEIILAIIIFPIAHLLLPILPVLLGVFLMISGVNQFFDTRATRKYVNVTPWLDYVYSILLLLFGIALVFNPWDILNLFFRIIGLGLIALAILEFINTNIYNDSKKGRSK